MKCMSCNEEVSPKFGHAIAKNECPYCGKEIIEPKLQELLSSLKTLMDGGKDYMPHIEDWLQSNYNLRKFDPENDMPVGFNSSFPQGKKPGRGVGVRRADEDDTSQDDVEMTPFAARAGMKSSGMSREQILNKIKGSSGVISNPMELEEAEEEVVNIPGSTEPLSQSEQRQLVDVFDVPKSQALELQKLKQLRNQLAGSGGFSRE